MSGRVEDSVGVGGNGNQREFRRTIITLGTCWLGKVGNIRAKDSIFRGHEDL